ncbi:unnamed protein product (macronuclear) [Paramecium tetraurelia]|uniref:Uncharacterized protein n=1 Tax=Paramecium tetraurelia TaxID=5888 RepID=A0BQW1_PARTE|nr:uncharacterized protein GSPATT00031157001 [Paramecium tetraurelia]CAK60928.1 unnamed protein product [Paramecium tetraurelia]|eukprot:XP_001428326.1 hypothetical protein (macronuclear) [Paramecium tetraurelia strain d4-2]
MLKLRIFLWRYKQNKLQQQTFLGSLKHAHSESNVLHNHFFQLQQIPNEQKASKIWTQIKVKQEIEEQVSNIKAQAKLIKLPHLNKQQILDALKLYNLSIQALLEGKREVVQNDKFVFKDGQSLQQKVDKIKDFLIKITNQ